MYWPSPGYGKEYVKRATAAHAFAIYLNLPQRIMSRTARRECARKYTPYKTAMCEHTAWTLWKPNERGINGEDWSNIISHLTFLWCNDQLSQINLPISVQWSFIWFDPRYWHLQHLCCEGVSRAPRPKARPQVATHTEQACGTQRQKGATHWRTSMIEFGDS